MKIVVDTNLVFSAILNINSTIGDVILNSGKTFQFYCSNFLWKEIELHQEKLLKISKKSLVEISELEHLIYNEITFISEEQIPSDYYIEAVKLVSEIDKKDIVFVALTEYLHSLLWTGDKKLISGLLAKGYKNVLSTRDMVRLRSAMD